ncbi:MAG: hypothetical protein ACJZ4M_02780 [Candidatus Thalassarchaeaceae archaeon]|tara:strand:+ start:105 stop:506 length:402 start_codon:yes stop_codon:yes gene_type:complete
MDVKEIMNPKYWMVGIGSLMLLMSVFGVMDGEQMAVDMWGADNVAEHDAEYEEMWALNMMSLFAMFVFIGVLAKGKTLAQLTMAASASSLVFLVVGMMVLTGDSEYDSSSLIIIIGGASALLGISGFLNKDGD